MESTNPFSVPSDWTYLTGVFESLDSSVKVYKNGSFQSTKAVLNRVVNDSTISIGKRLDSILLDPYMVSSTMSASTTVPAEEVQVLYNMGQ